MQVPILIEPLSTGGFRATAGAPFGLSAVGTTADEAARHLETALRARLSAGARLAAINLGAPVFAPPPFPVGPEDEWFFRTMEEVMAENRRREDEAAPP